MRINRSLRIPVLLLGFALLATACPADEATPPDDDAPPPVNGEDGIAQPTDRSLLDTVTSRGEVICGVNQAVPGFGFLTPEGEFEGFDVDFCRALAAAVLGSADAVDYVPLTAEARFTALQAGEIDVLIRNTTWTATRDGAEGAAFALTTFYDGQGMMVRADDPFETLEDMQNTAICVLSGTTTELNLESQFEARGIAYDPQSFEDNDTLREAFLTGACDGWTSDKSQLAAFRATWPDADGGPDSLRILDVTMSKEPLGPATLDGDSAWFDAVNWTVIATIQAEEFGITSQNIDDFMDSDDPEIRRFLGLDGFDPGLGLAPDFAEQIIRQVGNYAEIYERNVGPGTPLGLARGVNALWTADPPGLLYAPPYR